MHRFKTFIESIRTESNGRLISSILEGYDAILGRDRDSGDSDDDYKDAPGYKGIDASGYEGYKGGPVQVEFVNLTPHNISVRLADGETVTYPADGKLARVSVSEEDDGEISGIPVKRRVTGAVTGIPAPTEGLVYIVSSMVLSAVTGRDDVVAPDTGKDAIRNAGGQVEAVRGFIRN